jgi:putative ATPase
MRTVLFIDELHRFSRSQQDAILPHVEAGTVRLIGATTENPSLSINNALLSRCQVVQLAPLPPDAMRVVLERAVHDSEAGLGRLAVEVDKEAFAELERYAGGDARTALNALELAASATAPDESGRRAIGVQAVREALLHPALRHDRQGDMHYDLASALIKSIRGSDADAAVYWLARLIEAGEDPLFVARRVVISAAEDVGLADPAALGIAVAAYQATQSIGLPEARLPLSEAVIYLALAPKSNSGLRAYDAAADDVRRQPGLPVPLHLRNAVTGMMRSLGYGKGYRYAHDDPEGVATQDYLPENLKGRRYYLPSAHGREAELGERWQSLLERLHRRGGREEPGKGTPHRG